ncbi:MAG: hypothetical protein AAB434_11845 [Planctomycetota bacterium]
MKRRRRSAEVAWGVNCALALGALLVFWRTVVCAEELPWPENPKMPPQAVDPPPEECNAIWEAELYVQPPPAPPPPERPVFQCDGVLNRRVSLYMNGEPLDPMCVGDLLPVRMDGRGVRVGRIEKDEVILIIEDTVDEEIRVPIQALEESVRQPEPH